MRDTHEKFVGDYINKKTGAFNTPFDVEEAHDAKDEADLKKASEMTKFTVPRGMINDWTGNRFIYERPYGVANVQLDATEGYAYNEAEQERDVDHGYPSAYKSNKDLTDTVQEWIQGTGAFRNQFDVKAEEEYKLEKHQEETSKEPAFKVRADMINDWTGTKFVRERPYGAMNLQLQGKPEEPKKYVSKEDKDSAFALPVETPKPKAKPVAKKE